MLESVISGYDILFCKLDLRFPELRFLKSLLRSITKLNCIEIDQHTNMQFIDTRVRLACMITVLIGAKINAVSRRTYLVIKL